jgi:hypothetical protein
MTLSYNGEAEQPATVIDAEYIIVAARGLERFVVESITAALTFDSDDHDEDASRKYHCRIQPLFQNYQNDCGSQKASHDELLGKLRVAQEKKLKKARAKNAQKSRQQESNKGNNGNKRPKVDDDHVEALHQELSFRAGTVTVDVPPCRKGDKPLTRYMNIGFHQKIPTINNDNDKNCQIITSCPGAVEGTVLLKLVTNAPPLQVLSLRTLGVGPILAYVKHKEERVSNNTNTNSMASGSGSQHDSLEAAEKEMTRFMGGNNNGSDNDDTGILLHSYTKALELWHRAASTCWPSLWPDTITEERRATFQADLESKCRGQHPYSFRASCMRTQSSQFVDISRESLLGSIGSGFPWRDVARRLKENNKCQDCAHQADRDGKDVPVMDWKVDLTKYDFELVVFIYGAQEMALGITLLPYQHIGKRNFAGGKLPPDITPPYIMQGMDDIVTLRPSTAALLLHLANLKEGDIVVDPCAGIGTIPQEATFLHNNPRVISLGGDVGSRLRSYMEHYIQKLRQCNKSQRSASEIVPGRNSNKGAADMMAWDATLLPLRNECVDVIVSDLPFGQKCLSLTEVVTILPPLCSEMARVLRPVTGRCVLLCGSFQVVLQALLEITPKSTPTNVNQCLLFGPPSSIIPVNIGGFTAWIIIIQRSQFEWQPLQNHRTRVQKLTKRRETCESNNNK